VRLGILVAVLGLVVVPSALALSVDEALQMSQKTGRPILAMVGSKDCGACIALEKRLNTDIQAQPLVAEFIALKIDQATPDWQSWGSRFKSTGNTIPKVFVVRADGEQLFGQSSSFSSAELQVFLRQMLAQTGTALAPRQVEQLETTLVNVNKLLGEQQVEKAVQTIAPCLGTGSYAAAAVEIDKLGARLIDEAIAATKEAESKLTDPAQAFDGALELAALERTHAKLPPVADAVREIVKQHRREADVKELLAQAQLVDRAKEYEAKKNGKRAMSAYEAIAARYSDDPSGAYAQQRIAELEQSGVPRGGAVATIRTASTAGTSTVSEAPAKPERKAPAASANNLKKAKSLLNLGKNLLEKNPDRAREYLAQVIELVPDSDTALDAQDLLNTIR
jgi:hypothetical protein